MADEEINVLVFLGTARTRRQSERVFESLLEHIADRPWRVSTVDVRDFEMSRTLGLDDERWAAHRQLVEGTDAIIFVMPEYNHGYPGELKMVFDLLASEYEGKAAGFVGVSNGRLGGVRSVQSFMPLTSGVGMVPVMPTVLVTDVKNRDDDIFSDERLGQGLAAMADNLDAMTRTLRSSRE